MIDCAISTSARRLSGSTCRLLAICSVWKARSSALSSRLSEMMVETSPSVILMTVTMDCSSARVVLSVVLVESPVVRMSMSMLPTAVTTLTSRRSFRIASAFLLN